MYRKFKPPFFWPAISQPRQSCQFHFCLMKNPLLYRSAWPESSREASEGLLWRRSLELRASGALGLRWQSVLAPQASQKRKHPPVEVVRVRRLMVIGRQELPSPREIAENISGVDTNVFPF